MGVCVGDVSILLHVLLLNGALFVGELDSSELVDRLLISSALKSSSAVRSAKSSSSAARSNLSFPLSL